MAKDDLTGNMPTEVMLDWFKAKGIETGVHSENLNDAIELANNLF